MMGRNPIVLSHKAHLSLAVKLVQLFPSLGSTESSPGEEGLAHQGDSCSGFLNPQIKSFPSSPLQSCCATQGAEGGCWSDTQNVGHVPEIHILSWASLLTLCMY